MNKKIVLIKPINEALDIYYDLPLGLLQVGTLPKKEGYNVKIIDCILVKNFLDAIEYECRDAFIVGISVTSAQVREAIKISDFIKERFNVPIVWGGWHPTLFPEQTCADKSVDFVVIKEGDYTFIEIVKAIESNTPFDNIKGIAYKKDGSVVLTGYRKDLNMDELFQTDYELIDTKKYIRNRSGTVKIMYQSSRGCPYNCQFCINVVSKNQKYRSKSPQKVLDEIEFLVKKYGINYIDFIDDNTFIDIRRIRKICEGMIERELNIKWYGECRANYFRDRFVDNDFLDLAVKSGLSGLTIGAESGSEHTLKMMDKDITIEQILNSAKVLGQYKQIVPVYGFIIGIPGETEDNIKDTLNIVKKIRRLCPQMAFGVGNLRAYPKIGLTKHLVAKGILKEPQNLRGWLHKEVLEPYISNKGKPWQEDKKLIYNISFFARLGYATFGNSDIKDILKSPRRWYLLFDIPFVYIARFRFDNLFFFLPLDRFIYKSFRKIRSLIIDTLFIEKYSG